MKAIADFFGNLKKGTFFIKSLNFNSHKIFQKTGPNNARVYGSNDPIIVHQREGVIAVSKTNFGELPIVPFVLANSAKAPQGFIVPYNVLVKKPPPACPGSYGKAVYVNTGVCHSVNIKNDEVVFNLKDIFHFREVSFIEVSLNM